MDDLLHALKNMTRHYFDDHRDCRDYFCGNAGLVDNAALYLRLPQQVIEVIDAALKRVIMKVNSVLQDCTNNRAEIYMSMITKFTSGKMLHLTGRGGYQHQMQGAALSLNWGTSWHLKALKSHGFHAPTCLVGLASQRNIQLVLKKLCKPRSRSGFQSGVVIRRLLVKTSSIVLKPKSFLTSQTRSSKA